MRPINTGMYPHETETQSFMKLDNIIHAIDKEKERLVTVNTKEELMSGVGEDNSKYLVNRDVFKARHMSR